MRRFSKGSNRINKKIRFGTQSRILLANLNVKFGQKVVDAIIYEVKRGRPDLKGDAVLAEVLRRLMPNGNS